MEPLTLQIRYDEFREIADPAFLHHWFSEEERTEYSNKVNPGSLAVRYLLKKALLGYTALHLKGNCISILNDEWGAPMLSIPDEIRQALIKAGTPEVLFSFSHTRIRAVVLIVFN